MTTASRRSWTGYSPLEISRRTNTVVLDQHASDAAFYWERRCSAVGSDGFRFRHLADVDELLDAHLDGLHAARDAGWQLAFDEASQMQEPAELFPAAVIGVCGQVQSASLLAVLEATEDRPDLNRAVISALGWVDLAIARERIKSLLSSRNSRLVCIGVSACRVHRFYPGDALVRVLRSPEPRARCAVLQCIGELGRIDTLPTVLQRLEDPEPLVRFWAAWCAVRLGSRDSGVHARLFEAAAQPGSFRARAADLWVRVGPRQNVEAWLAEPSQELQERLLRLGCIGSFGGPETIPSLIIAMADEALSSTAASAFAMITGIDLEFEDLVLDETADDSEEDGDTRTVPDVERIARRWSEIGSMYRADERYLVGVSLAQGATSIALAQGTQLQRRSAAIERGLRAPHDVTPNVAAPAGRQKRAGWTS